MAKSCVICGGEESDGELLLEAPCGRHWVCTDDIASFFERATTNESLFPPKCCGQMFMLHEYEDYIPFETIWAYQVKEQGEYAILAKFRVYCANPPCSKFLHPTLHVQDPDTEITYAICESEECNRLTCITCKTLLDHGTQNHFCRQDEDDRKFKATAKEKGYQECFVCGTTVELAEACNHMTCDCGHEFCYICGKNWEGLHGCPHYGPAVYDEDGFNQDGFHRDTGRNRQGRSRRQETARARGDPDPEEEENRAEEDDPQWEVLQHLSPEHRAMIRNLPDGQREDALDQFRIILLEEQGITFNQGQDPPNDRQQEVADDATVDIAENETGEETQGVPNAEGEVTRDEGTHTIADLEIANDENRDPQHDDNHPRNVDGPTDLNLPNDHPNNDVTDPGFADFHFDGPEYLTDDLGVVPRSNEIES